MYCKSNLFVQYNCKTDSKKRNEGSSGIGALPLSSRLHGVTCHTSNENFISTTDEICFSQANMTLV
jgi:hypothetical protein